MGILKNIEIDGKEVQFKASAAIPRIYRLKFGRDIYKDLQALEKSVGSADENNSNLDLFSLEMFENIAYVMAKHAAPQGVLSCPDGAIHLNKTIADTPEDWLDEFNTFSIYQVLPKIIELWGLNMETEIKSKKNPVAPKEK